MPKKIISYLESIRFDPKLFDTWWGKYITQFRLVIMLILAMVVVGIFGYINIPRRLNPEINIAIVTVTTVLPGASPEDMEQLVTTPLEDAISGVKDIDTLTSTSVDSTSNIVLQFKSGVDGDQARTDVKSAVDTVTLPSDAMDPRVFKLDFEDAPIWTFAVTGNTDETSLMRFSNTLKNKIEDLAKVDRVVLSGYDNQYVEVVLDPEKMASLGLTPIQISQAIQKLSSSYPAGAVETNTSSFSLTIDRDINNLDDLRNTLIIVGNQTLRLGDFAKVSYISQRNQNNAYFATHTQNPTPTVQFFVYKSKSSNIDAAEKDVHALVDQTIKDYNGQFQVTNIQNNANEITNQFNELTREFSTTVLLVFILLLIFLGLRQAVISSLTVPLTFLSSFAIIYALGLSLNFLTTFSFLIALGVLIDDAIVVVAAMTRYFATGRFTPAQTGALVWRDFIVPLVSTAITTIWAFVPLLLASGIIGEFIKTIPIVVTVTMASSTLIALFITLPLMIVFLKPNFPRRVRILLYILGILTPIILVALIAPKTALLPVILILFIATMFVGYRERTFIFRFINKGLSKNKYLKATPSLLRRISDHGLLDIEVLSRSYMRIIDRILVSKHGKRATIIAILAFTLLAYLLVPLGFVKNEFFPKTDSNLLYVSGELPFGTNLNTSTQEMLEVLSEVKNTDQVEYVVGETGAGFSAGMGRDSNANSFLLTLHLIDKDKRSIKSWDIAQNLREQLQNYQGAKVTVQEESGGPPAGADIQIKLLGDDLDVLNAKADQVVTYLQTQPGVTNVDKSIKPGTGKLVFVPNKEKLVQNNLTVDQVALWMRTYASGYKLDSLKFGQEKDKTDIVFRLTAENQTPDDLGRLLIPVSGSQTPVPLLSLGTITLAPNPTAIAHEDKKRTVSVTAAVTAGHNPQEINANLEKFARGDLQLAQGYSWKTGGVNDENQKSVQSIIQAMVISFLLILVTMVIEFRSFRQTFIALMFIPLSISGVFYVFALTGTPLSFPALIGVLALFGIVVRHAIVVIEKINDDLHEGMDIREAVVDAAGNRLEPVLLTSLAAIVGLIPITISNPLWRGLGGAIIAGLLFSGLIKLFFVPVMYYMFFPTKKR